jgi:hypothetical protein
MIFNTLPDVERAAAYAARVWVHDMYFKSPLDDGAVPVPMSVYEGHVPMYQAGEMGSAPKAPSIAIRAQSASWKHEFGEVHLNFAILTWNDELSRRGYRDVENVAWRLNQGVYEARGLPPVTANSDGSFTMGRGNLFQLTDHPTTFELIEDPAVDFFPYFIGVFAAVFSVPTPEPDEAVWNELVNPSFTVSIPTPPAPQPHR